MINTNGSSSWKYAKAIRSSQRKSLDKCIIGLNPAAAFWFIQNLGPFSVEISSSSSTIESIVKKLWIALYYRCDVTTRVLLAAVTEGPMFFKRRYELSLTGGHPMPSSHDVARACIALTSQLTESANKLGMFV